jgi:hypothetical protein
MDIEVSLNGNRMNLLLPFFFVFTCDVSKRKSNVNFNHLLPSISLLTHTIDRSSIESDNGTNHRHSLVCLL